MEDRKSLLPDKGLGHHPSKGEKRENEKEAKGKISRMKRERKGRRESEKKQKGK